MNKGRILHFFKVARLVEKLFHNVALAVGPAVIVVGAEAAQIMPNARIRHRLDTVCVVFARLAYIIILGIDTEVGAYFIHTLVYTGRVRPRILYKLFLGNGDIDTAHGVDYLGHTVKVYRCILGYIEVEYLIKRSYRGYGAIGISRVYF